MSSNMKEAAEKIVDTMNFMTAMAIGQIDEGSIRNASSEDLIMAKFVIELKDAMSDYLIAEANEIHEINMRLGRLNKPAAQEKANRD